MNIHIKEKINHYAPIKYVLKLIERNRNIRFSFVNDINKAKTIQDHDDENSEGFNYEFYGSLKNNIKMLKHENINLFHNRIYQSNRTMEQFLWKFHKGPFGKSIYVIAEDNGKVVGTNCVIPINLITSNSETIRSGKSEDTLVNPEYRGQKIFYKIYDFLFEKSKEANIQVIWGFTSAKKPFKKLGFEIPYDHQKSLTVNHVWKSYKYLSSLNNKNKVIDKIKIFGLCIMSKLKTVGKSKPLKLAYRIEKIDRIISGVDDLILQNQMKLDNSFAIH